MAKRPSKRSAPKRPAPRARARATKGFVGRDGSPVLEKYPPKDPGFGTPRRVVVTSAPAPTATPLPTAGPAGAPPSLITFERPFDLDEFSSLLGQTSIRVTVPRADLPALLARVTEFMGFGIYVYTISVRPGPAELLKEFVVELQRVDYAADAKAWRPFVEKGAVDGGRP